MTVSVNGCKGCDITMVKAERGIYISKNVAQHDGFSKELVVFPMLDLLDISTVSDEVTVNQVCAVFCNAREGVRGGCSVAGEVEFELVRVKFPTVIHNCCNPSSQSSILKRGKKDGLKLI